MERLISVADGYECSASPTAGGWLAAVKVIPGVDEGFLKPFDRLEAAEYVEGATERDWSRAFCAARQQVVLLERSAGGPAARVVAEAERIEGPTTCGGQQPGVAWAERREDAWRLMLWRDGVAGAVTGIPRPGSAPAVASAGERLLVAVADDRAGAARVRLVDGTGALIFETPGRYPRVAGAPDGSAVLVVERAAPDRVDLVAYLVRVDGAPVEVPVPGAGDFNMGADLLWHEPTARFWLAWASCPCWGLDERVGLHHDLWVRTLAPTEGAWRAARGTCDGHVHVEATAFLDASSQNLSPSRPVLFPDGDDVGLAFRRFRYTGRYSHGWDTYVKRGAADGWAGPFRVSPDPGQGDPAYAVVRAPAGGGLVAFCPSFDIDSGLTLAEEAAGAAWRRTDRRTRRQRIDVIELAPDEALPAIEPPAWKRSVYVIHPSISDPAPDPPRLEQGPDGRTLIWADLHAHSAYSKCMGCDDGQPLDVLRHQRDVLGCRVLCLTDHVEYMNGGEFAHVMDSIEREAGAGYVPLYGVEWARYPAHHTNFFAIDRRVFDRLRTLMFEHAHLTALYEAIRVELPAGSVVAIRHMHGEDEDAFGVSGARVAETHDPRIEWAMEAMQTRGNMMVDGMRGLYPCFPANFLNAGCKVGVVGGSDHSRGDGVNAFCLTGLWVTAPTAEGVFEALRGRHTLGVANGKVAVHATLVGAPTGACGDVPRPVRVKVRLSCSRTIRRVCLMRDGLLLPWQEVAACAAELDLVDDTEASPGAHWYSVTVEGPKSHRKGPLLAHTSPFFVSLP